MRCFRRSWDHFCSHRATQPVVHSHENGTAVLDGHAFDASDSDDGDSWIRVETSDDEPDYESESTSENLLDPTPVRPEPCEMARPGADKAEMRAKPKEENI